MNKIQGPLDGLDVEALCLIKEQAKWKWHPGIYGFVNEFGNPDQKAITRAELVRHHLFGPTSEAERAAGLAWLTERLQGKPAADWGSRTDFARGDAFAAA